MQHLWRKMFYLPLSPLSFYTVVALTIAHLCLCCCFVSSFLLVWKIMPACVMISMSPAAWDKNHNIGISSCSIKVAAFRFCIKWFNHYCALKQCPSQFWQLTLFQGRCVKLAQEKILKIKCKLCWRPLILVNDVKICKTVTGEFLGQWQKNQCGYAFTHNQSKRCAAT